MASKSDPLAEELLNRYTDLKGSRDAIFETDWQSISQYFLPQSSDIQVKKTESVSGWTQDVYDTTGVEAAETLKMGQFNWLTPPNQPWGRYDVPEELLDEDGNPPKDAKDFMENASDVARRELGRSNFYSIAASDYLGVGVFGTDLITAEEGKKTLLNFKHAKIGTYVIEESDEGLVDTTMRAFEMTYRQAKQMFSKNDDTLPADMERQAKGPQGLKKKFKFLHCIFPREDSKRIPNRKDGKNKPIASVYIAMDFSECVRISGYDEQPALCSRYDKWGSGSPYGYSPAYLGLPIARQLNYVQQYLDALAELHAYPRVLVPDNLEGDVDLRAGGSTIINSAEGSSKPEEWATAGEYKLGLEMQEQRRKQLRDMFMTDAFKLLNSMPLLDKKMTAYEISQRQAENLAAFTPSLARRITEFLNPLMIRVFGILYRAGKFGKAPDSLLVDAGNGKLGLVLPNVVITNRLTDALKALKNRSTEETFQFLQPMAEFKPEVYDNFDLDKVVRDYAENSGMSSVMLLPMKGPKGVERVRAARAQMMEQQRQAAITDQMASAGANLGKSPEFVQQRAKESMEGKAA